MQLLPPPGKGRPLALILLLIVLVLAYLLLVHWWFVAPHLRMAGEISQLKQQEALFRGVIASRPMIEQRLQEVRQFESGSPSFLPEGDFNSAAAALHSRLRSLIEQAAEVPERCQINSHQPTPSAVEEQYERVSLAVHMRCDIDDFSEILHALESGKPLLFVDQLTINRQVVGGAVRGRRPVPGAVQPGATTQLNFSFQLYGYLRQPGPGATRT